MKKLILIVLILLLSVMVSANSQYKIDNIKCYGQIFIQVNDIQGSSNYTFQNCVQINPILWGCNCGQTPILYNTLNETTTISFRIQYDISQPKSNDDIYNQQLKRVVTKSVIISTIKEKGPTPFEELINNSSGIIIVFGIIILLIVVGAIITVILFFNMDKIKRWLGVDEDEKMTLKEIIVAIFTRSNIKRRRFEKIQVNKKQQISEKNVDEKVENEVNELMKGL